VGVFLDAPTPPDRESFTRESGVDVQAMRQQLEQFYRDQYRQKFRVREGKRHRLVQELVNSEWVTVVSVDEDHVDKDDAVGIAHQTVGWLVSSAVNTEMAKLEGKAGHGRNDGGPSQAPPAGPCEVAPHAGQDEPAGGVLFPAPGPA
jgi:hypothetical protein